jgi:hypothetical protein
MYVLSSTFYFNINVICAILSGRKYLTQNGITLLNIKCMLKCTRLHSLIFNNKHALHVLLFTFVENKFLVF